MTTRLVPMTAAGRDLQQRFADGRVGPSETRFLDFILTIEQQSRRLAFAEARSVVDLGDMANAWYQHAADGTMTELIEKRLVLAAIDELADR